MIKRTMIALLVGFAPALGAQQSVGAPNTAPAPSRADVTKAREATAMKCLTWQAIAAQTLNAPGEARLVQAAPEAKRPTRGGMGLGTMDASEGMSRPPLNPQLHEVPGFDRTQRGTQSLSGAMAARNGVVAHCTPVPVKTTGDSSTGGKSHVKPDSVRIKP
ncbi:MAG: hypothetical protein IBJ03_09085 [Gemmatimonadaceae bacterium]|nr:hypothetical protein [Gemmatimonadaceae bacterium]